MAQPVCPVNYSCTFSPDRAPTYDFWWQGPWGVVAGIAAIVALACLLAYLGWLVYDHADNKRIDRERDRERRYKLDVEQQRTMQLDAAKGDPDMLKLVRDMQT